MNLPGSSDCSAISPLLASELTLLRVDASEAIGSGHLVRCMALASVLREAGARPVFACARVPPALQRLLDENGFEVIRIPATTSDGHHQSRPFDVDQIADSDNVISAMRKRGAFGCVIVDHYGVGREWESRLRSYAPIVVVIDDLADRPHDADVLIDAGIQQGEHRYARLLPTHCRQLLGPGFALLRPEFKTLRPSALTRRLDKVGRAVLFAGGMDATNLTARVLESWALLDVRRPVLDVIVGDRHHDLPAIEKRCESLANVRLHVQTAAMADLLGRADLLIGSAGTVSWERCCLGVPAVMFAAAENQRSNAHSLARFRTGLYFGSESDFDATRLAALLERLIARPSLLHRMSKRAAALVDGTGAQRVALLLYRSTLSLRDACPQDALMAWTWRNHTLTRRFSRNTDEISVDVHRDWWLRTLQNPSCRLLIARCIGQDVGVLRLDSVAARRAEVSIYLNPAFQGLGLGTAVLRAGQAWLRENSFDRTVLVAYILPTNQASRRAFECAGFEFDGERWVWGEGGGET